MRNAAASLVFAIALPWATATVAQTPLNRITQAAVIELQWRHFQTFSESQRAQGVAIDDAARTVGVDRVFARLLPVVWRWFPDSLPLRWEVLLTDDESIEAHAYPSGQIVLSARFASRFIHSDDELAFLLGHEMAHVLLEHGRRGYEAAVPFTRLSGPVDAQLMHDNLQSNPVLLLNLYPLLRAQESEADRFGVELAAAAGFGPSAAADLLSRMAEAGDDRSPTHDSLKARSAALRSALAD